MTIDTFDHFNESVPTEVREALLALAESAKESLVSEIGEALYCANINNIHGVHYDGFVAYQKGGFEVSELISFDTDSTYHIDDQMTENANIYYEYMLECASHDLEFDCQDWNSLTEDQREEFGEYENEWFEPALIRFEVWVDDDDQIFVRLSVNDTDAPYYRSASDRTLYEKHMSQADLLTLDVEAFLQEFENF